MGSAGGIIQVVRSNSSVPIASFQQLCNVSLCLHLHFPAYNTHGSGKPDYVDVRLCRLAYVGLPLLAVHLQQNNA